MSVLKITKMYSKILVVVVVLLAFFLDHLSAASLKSVQPTSLNGQNTPEKFKNSLVINQPSKSQAVNLHRTVSGNVNVNPVVPNNVPIPPASPVSERIQTINNDNGTNKNKSPIIPTVLPSIKNGNGLPPLNLPKSGNPSVSVESYEEDMTEEEIEEEETLKNNQVETSPVKNPLKTALINGINNLQVKTPASKAQIPTTVPTNVNNNHQVLNKLEKGDDSYDDYEEEEGDDYEEEEEEGYDYEEEEGDDYEEEIEDKNHEKLLENSKTVPSPNQSKPMLSSSSSKVILPEIVKQGNDNQEFDILEEGNDYYEDDDDYDEEGDQYDEEVEDTDHGEPLENSKTVASPNQSKPTFPMTINTSSNKFQTSKPMPSSSTFKPTVPESVKQENDNREFHTLGEDDEEVDEENEDDQYSEEYLEDPIHSTPLIPTGSINGVQDNNNPEPINNPNSTVPQVSEYDLTDSNYNGSEYYFNTDEDHQAYQNYESELESSNIEPTDSNETINRKNDNTKDQPTNNNEIESNPSDNTQITPDKQEGNIDDQFNNQSTLENKENIINGYNAMKRILYMLHDYASLAFNWIINKINYQMELASS